MTSKDSKTNFASLRERILGQNGKNGKQYWRSIEEFADTPEFAEYVKQEFPQQAEEWDNGVSRRNFIKVMGASLALAGLSGCVIQPPEKIVPYVAQPEEILPGKALFFATAMTLGGIATGLLGKSNEGRPTKIEGNPQHPGSLGATDVRAQASLLDLYDPDRSQEVVYLGASKTWQAFITDVRSQAEQYRAAGGAGIRFLSETVTSPTLVAQMRQLAAELPNSRWYQYEPVNQDNATAGAKMAFGAPVQTVYKFDQADRILSLDKDIFSDFNVRYMKDYAKKRAFNDQQKDINRLYVVETTMSLTGAKADHRLGVKPSQVAEIAKAIAGAIGVAGASSTAQFDENTTRWIQGAAKDLQATRGRSIVIAGDSQPPMVHALAHAMNQALGNVGTTVTYTEPFAPFADQLQSDQLRTLIQEIDSGAVKMLIIVGGNPVYNTPIDLKLSRERMDKIPYRVHLSRYLDETSELCHWHISEKHYLEMWSDTRAYDGTVTLVQPLVQPLYDSKSAHELVQAFFRENFDRRDIDIVKEFWQRQGLNAARAVGTAATTANGQQRQQGQQQQTAPTGTNASQGVVSPQPSRNFQTGGGGEQTGGNNRTGTEGGDGRTSNVAAGGTSPAIPATGSSTQNADTNLAAGGRTFEDQWRSAVHLGFIPNSAAPTRTVSANTAFLSQPQTANTGGALEVVILPDPNIYDGRFANNGWMQELPKPINKITWDNVALVSPKTAEELQLNQGREPNEQVGGEQGTSFINTKGGNLFSDLVKLKYNGAEISQPVPVWVQPGQPDGVVTIFMGYGRTRAGRVGNNIGYNAFEVRRSDAAFGTGELNRTGAQTTIASTQTHFNMEGRDIIRIWDVEQFKQHPEMGKQKDYYDYSMYPRFDYSDNGAEWRHKWGMSIDLNSCVGCNACVIACQSENNIPVVGKEQVERSREMHWLRVDAYYVGGDVNNPADMAFQPLPCQQCELAPCEVVCPVHATVHSAEGLNDMVYNRCVGTRYCSNNCPYKVRRFNFLLYQDWNTPQYKLMRNPEVTIRSRGVMEKCTYCTQRLALARIEARKDNRRVVDGEATTACQTVCPTDAIIFGDLNDENSLVAKLKNDKRNYTLLHELNTQPRTTYLSSLRNQNPEMPDYVPPQEIPKQHESNPQEGQQDKGVSTGQPTH
jgi:MoCo/4Fe-4S cofactor protein with predicted Tat translocation signal